MKESQEKGMFSEKIAEREAALAELKEMERTLTEVYETNKRTQLGEPVNLLPFMVCLLHASPYQTQKLVKPMLRAMRIGIRKQTAVIEKYKLLN